MYYFDLPIGTTGNNFRASVNDLYKCRSEDYILTPHFSFECEYEDIFSNYLVSECDTLVFNQAYETYGNRGAISLESVVNNGSIEISNFPLSTGGWAFFTGKSSAGSLTPHPDANIDFTAQASVPAGSGIIHTNNYQVTSILIFTFSTNVPVFETDSERNDYIRTGEGLENAVNYDVNEPEGEDFEISNIWAHGTWSASGLSGMSGQNYRLVKGRILSGGRISFYPIEGISDGALKYGIASNAEFDGLQYSIDGVNWLNSSTFPFNFFYRERDKETGTFDFGLTFFSQIPVFEDEETSEKWNDEDPSVSIEDAINWPQISGKYPITNRTGDALTASEFGHAKFQSVFSQQYILDINCLQSIAADLYDTSVGGVWEAIKKGLDMYGANPIDAVMGLSFWPVSIASILKPGSTVSAQYIWFGGYGWDVSAHSGSATQIIYPDNEIIIGTIRIMPSFGNSWRDYEPYTKLYVSLPYCGTYQLDLARYMDKDVQVKYYIDTRTGGCIAVLSVMAENGWFCTDYFNGQMAVSLPISLTNFSEYMNSQLQILLQGGGQATQALGSGASSIMSAGGGLALAGAALGAAGGAGIAGAAIGAKTVYGLTQNNKNNFNKTKGGSSSMINCLLPQTVDFLFEIQEDCAPSNYGKLIGYPSFAAGTVSSFSGFLKCQAVKLECSIATERERERLKQMLLSGIYI